MVGERASELAQLAAVAMAAGMSVEQFAAVPFSFPTYASALDRAALRATRELDGKRNVIGEGGLVEDADIASAIG